MKAENEVVSLAVRNSKLICYDNTFQDGHIDIWNVYKLENYDYNIHSKEPNIVKIILDYEEGIYNEKYTSSILRNNSGLYGTIFRRYSTKSGMYVDFPRESNRNRTNAENKTNREGVPSNAGEEIYFMI
jgi:hypothetical protein